jgi:hypothetical protein
MGTKPKKIDDSADMKGVEPFFLGLVASLGYLIVAFAQAKATKANGSDPDMLIDDSLPNKFDDEEWTW